MRGVVIVKMRTLFGEEFEIVEKKKVSDEERIHDNSRCMHAKGLKCKCRCHSAFHGIVWKRKIEKLDKFLEIENEAAVEVMG